MLRDPSRLASAPPRSILRNRACTAHGDGIAILLLAALGVACNRGEHEPSPAPSASPAVVAAPSAEPSASIAPPVAPAPSASQAKSEPGTSTSCASDADCRTFSDTCGACSCRPLTKTSPESEVHVQTHDLLGRPLHRSAHHVQEGQLRARRPRRRRDRCARAGEGSGLLDVAAKGASSAAPAASTAPKVTTLPQLPRATERRRIENSGYGDAWHRKIATRRRARATHG